MISIKSSFIKTIPVYLVIFASACLFPDLAQPSPPPQPAPEFPLDQLIPGESRAFQDKSDAAGDGDVVLAVWEDERECYSSIYGARVLFNPFTLEDSVGFRISPEYRNAENPRVAASGQGIYCVVWAAIGVGVIGIEAARIDDTGNVLDASPIEISGDFSGTTSFPAVDFDGEAFVIVWYMPGASRQDVFGVRLSLDGTIIDPGIFLVSDAPENQVRTDIACGGDSCLAVFRDTRADQDGPDIYGCRIHRLSGVLDPNGILITAADNIQTSPRVAFNGQDFLVVWEDARDDPNGLEKDVYGARVALDGTVLDPDPSSIQIARVGGSNQAAPASLGLAMDAIVTWADDRGGDFDLYRTKVDRNGTVIDPGGLVLVQGTGFQGVPRLALANSGPGVFYVDDKGSGTEQDISLVQMGGDGAPLDTTGHNVSGAAQRQQFPAIAFNGSMFLAVWEDYRHAVESELYAARILSDGTVLDPAGIRLTNHSQDDIRPAVASDGQDFMILWERQGLIYGVRVSDTGAIIGPPEFDVKASTGGTLPCIAWGQSSFLAAWEDARGAGDIWGTRIDPDGTVQDVGGRPFVNDGSTQFEPALAFGGGSFLMVFSDNRINALKDLYMVRLDEGGTPLDPVEIPLNTSALSVKGFPSITHGANGFLVAWEDSRFAFPSQFDIFAARVADDMTILDSDGILLSDGWAGHGEASVTALVDGFLIMWLDGWDDRKMSHVNAARIDNSGVLLDPGGVTLSTYDGCRNSLATAVDQSGVIIGLVEGFWAPQCNAIRVQGMIVENVYFTKDMSRWGSKAALQGPPDQQFLDVTLPWQDPDQVLTNDPAWTTLYYSLDVQGQTIYLTKSSSTVEVSF
ncbi:hypothetical protein ACFLU6_05140 [Acidobacteriota bacterium]